MGPALHWTLCWTSPPTKGPAAFLCGPKPGPRRRTSKTNVAVALCAGGVEGRRVCLGVLLGAPATLSFFKRTSRNHHNRPRRLCEAVVRNSDMQRRMCWLAPPRKQACPPKSCCVACSTQVNRPACIVRNPHPCRDQRVGEAGPSVTENVARRRERALHAVARTHFFPAGGPRSEPNDCVCIGHPQHAHATCLAPHR